MQNSSTKFPFFSMYYNFIIIDKYQKQKAHNKTPLEYKYICGNCNKNNYHKICKYCNNTDHFHKKNVISKFYRKIIKCKTCKENDKKDKLDLLPPFEYKSIFQL